MRIKSAIAVIGLGLFGLVGSLGAAWAAEPTGAAYCVTCHDEEDLPDMSRTPHGFAADKRAPDCISCHGPSEGHAHKPAGAKSQPKPDITYGKTRGKNTSVPAFDRSKACLSCHEKDSKRALWAGSQHQAADVACDTCHQVHTSRDKILKKTEQAQACFTCHKEQRTQVNWPSHHPIVEGKMTCSDCHNVHGSAGPKLVTRDSINDTCYTCHAEKRGPFVHEHEPVAEDCSNCHNPHGSIVAGMLKARAPMLCQQCHTPHVAGGVGAVGGQTGIAAGSSFLTGKNTINLWQGRSCLNCHTQVHGSNNPSTLNPTPQLMMR